MQLLYLGLALLPLSVSPVLGDFVGPSWPAPSDLTGNKSLVANGFKNLSTTLQDYIELDDTNQTAIPTILNGISNLTFSIGMFSLHDLAASKLQFHYTSPEIANSLNGTHKVDADSIYRVASVTKVFTVLAGLLELNTTDWDRSLADVFPLFAEYVKENAGEKDPIHTVEWDKVTLSALSAQIAGVPREGYPSLNEILMAATTGVPDPTTMGLPPYNQSDPLQTPPCALLNTSTCPPDTYIQSVANRPPTFLPWTSPGYANNGFALLGMAMSKITGRSVDKMFLESIFEPLGMDSSNTTAPPLSKWDRAVIPGDIENFAFDSGVFVSSGTVSSTLNDMAKFGLAILNSTLLPDDETRWWLKPVTHTARLQYSVGRPWEIHRYTNPSGVVTDLYTKSGDSGAYSAFLVLLPDYGAGFSLLSASTMPTRFDNLAGIADAVTEAVVPALAAEAGVEAAQRFAGTYSSNEAGLNTSLVLTVNQTESDAPGLVISSWISNGTNVLDTLTPSPGFPPWRLLPSISDTAHGKMAFRLVSGFDAPNAQPPVGPSLFSGRGFLIADWISADSVTYGGIGTTLFVFDIDCAGQATAVSPAAFRVKLERDA